MRRNIELSQYSLGDSYAVSVDGFGIVFIDLEGEQANVRVYDGFTNIADLTVSLVKDRKKVDA